MFYFWATITKAVAALGLTFCFALLFMTRVSPDVLWAPLLLGFGVGFIIAAVAFSPLKWWFS